MHFPGQIPALVLGLFLAGCSVAEPTEQLKTAQPVQVQELNLPVTIQVSEELACQLEQGTAQDFLRDNGILEVRRVFPHAGIYEERVRREGMHRFFYVTWDPEHKDTKAAASLEDVPGIQHVTPQFSIQLRTFNDPYFSSQWHFVNSRYANADINVQKVWDEFTVGNSNVIVSVVDEGVDMDHEDLAANLVPCYPDGSGSYNFNNNTPTVVPYQGHGTHVAGVIAAVSNNGKGVAGLAGGNAGAGIPGVKVMSCQIMDMYGNQPDYYAAMTHGADHGAVILQCSWGFSPDLDHDGYTTEQEKELYRSYTINDLPEYKAAIDYFIKYAGCDNDGNQLPDSPMQGGVVVFAAGNDNYDYDPLVSYDAVIAVGAYGASGSKASYSNWGDWVDIAAPGGDGKQGIYSTVLSNGYGGPDWIGTSMACPHVSGVAALLVSYFGGPGFTAEECKERILRGAVANFSTGSRYIGKKLDAYGAFTVDLDAPVQEPKITIDSALPTEFTHRQVEKRRLTVLDPAGQRVWVLLEKDIPGVSLSEDYELTVDATQMEAGQYSIAVSAVNEDHAGTRFTHSFRVLPNQFPVNTDQVPDGILVEGSTLNLSVAGWFTDGDQDPLSYTVSVTPQELATATVSEDGQLTIEAKSRGVGKIAVEASDGEESRTVLLPLVLKDAATTAFLYPAVATSTVSVVIDATQEEDVQWAIYSASGAQVLAGSCRASLFQPVNCTVTSLAPGLYTLKLTYSNKTKKLTFSKK
jgi:hypothetical protein